jgi:cellulose synthase/poly-beta-1,6-N-acetylglucosamine synthase-like glycosyltransferase
MTEAFVEKYDKQITRALEIIPGVLTWAFILSPIWMGILYPQAIIYLIAFLTIYWSYMALKQTAGMMLGYPQYKKEMAEDWWAKCQDLNFDELPDKPTLPDSLADVRQIIIVPVVNEPEEILRPAIESIYNQTFPVGQIVVVYTIEQKFAQEVKATLNKILGDRVNDFYKFLVYEHPAGIPGEAIGSGGGNRTWGGKHAVEQLEKDGEDIKDYIFTSFDADHVPDRQFFARLTHLYLNTDLRNNRFFATAVHLFNNNHWNVPSMMRIEANFVTLGTLSNRSIFWSSTSNTTDTFASFSNSLQTLIDAGYWDVASGADDTTYFWRAFFARDGEFRAEKHYIPYSADAVEGNTYLAAHKSLYKQLLRWGWGVVEIPLSVKEFLTNTRIPLSKKLMWVFDHFKTRVFLINIVFLITFGFGLLTLVNPNVKQSSFAYALPTVMRYILTVTLIFLIPAMIYRAKLTPPIPKSWPLWRKFLNLLEGILVIFNLLTFSFIPMVDAQTRMMFGKKMKDLYHTPKVRKKF